MPSPPAPHVLLAAPPGTEGAQPMLEALASDSGDARPRVLLTGDGLDWLEPGALATLRATGAELSLCSRSARDRGLDAARVPEGVRWSSLVAFFRDRPPEAPLWSALP